MLSFKNTDVQAVLIVTLTEKVTLDDPVYVFTFTHVLTKQQVTFNKTPEDDESAYTNRYNQFTIDTAPFTLPGEWHYTVTEQATNVELETGKLIITKDFSYKTYDDGGTGYKTYNG